MVAHMSTHRTGEDWQGGVQKGQRVTETCVVATRGERHKDPKPCRQNPACAEQGSRQSRQEAEPAADLRPAGEVARDAAPSW